MSGDPNFSSVSLLLHCDGTNGSAVFTDNSNNAFTVTANNGAVISTTTPKFGTGELQCGSSKYLSVPISAAGPLDLGSGDWTFELWLNPATVSASQIFAQMGTYPGNGFFIQQNPSGSVQCTIQGVSASVSSQPLTIGTYSHIALVQTGGTTRLFVDGVGTSDSHVTSAAFTTSVTIGEGLANSGIPSTGKIDEIRITKGLARYTTNFTPPASAFANGSGPTISVQPTPQSVTDPATATFSVTASGTAPVTYQWYRNNVSLGGGATSSSYTTPATSHAVDDGASYKVIVTDLYDSVTSNSVILSVASGASVFAAYTDPNKPFIPLELWLVMHSIRTIPGYNKGQRRTECYRAQAAGETWIRRDSATKQYYARRPKND